MTSRTRWRVRTRIAFVATAALALAACGSDDDTPSGSAAATTAAPSSEAPSTEAPSTEAPSTEAPSTEAPGSSVADTTASSGSTGSAGCPAIDSSLDDKYGQDAGRFISDINCSMDHPLKAEGDPIVVGFENPEGDPNGSFPEYSVAAQAAVDYINSELGGLGADIQNGVPGRPIQLEVCKSAISPDDSQRCANEIISKDPFVAFSSINFFGNNLSIFTGAGVPAIVITPVTIADFTSEGVYSIGGGGGCLGVHTGMVEFATSEFKDVKKVSVPWADTAPGVVCYYDLESKPLDVLAGTVEGSAERAGSMPGLEHIGVPIKPATPDLTSQVSQILGYDPDVIMFSAQGADCWNLVGALGAAGWTPDQTPLVLSGACIDFDAMKEAGDLAKGIYFVGSSGALLNDPSTIEDPVDQLKATVYQQKGAEYGLDPANLQKGFGTAGFIGMMSLWEQGSEIVVSGGELTADSIKQSYADTDGDHLFGSTPLSCSTAPKPYIAVCNGEVSATQWDGTQLVPVRERFSGVDLVAGTELKPGP